MQRFGWALAALTVSVGLGGCGGGTKSPTPPALTTQGVARFDVDVATGKVTISKLDTTRAVYSGSAVSFTSSDLLSVGGDAGKRLIRVSAVNNSGESWDASAVNLVVANVATADAARVRENVRVSTIAGNGSASEADGMGAAASLWQPFGVVVGKGPGKGALFAADYSGQTIRRIEADGMVTTVAGSAGLAGFADGTGAEARFNGPVALATDGNGNLFVSDQGNRRIRRVTPLGQVTTIAGSGAIGSTNGQGDGASFSGPNGLVASADGNRIYVANRTGHNVRLVAFTGIRRDQASSYTVSTVAGAVTSGLVDGSALDARFYAPSGIALVTDAAGVETLFVADHSNQALRRIAQPAGAATVTTCAGDGVQGVLDGLASSARLSNPSGVDAVQGADGSLDLYVGEFPRLRVVHYTAGGDPGQKGSYRVDTVAGQLTASGNDGTGLTAGFGSPQQVVVNTQVGPSTMVYVADYAAQKIRSVSVPSGAFHSGSSGGASPDAVAMLNYDRPAPNRAAYVSQMTKLDGSYAAELQFQVPSGVSGFSFLATIEAESGVVNLPASGFSAITTIAGTGRQGYRDGEGSIADFMDPCSIVGVPEALRSAYRSGTGRPIRAFVVDRLAEAVRYVDTAGQVGTFAGGVMGYADGVGEAARFAEPVGLAIDSAGALWVADEMNHRIRRILPNGVVTTVAGSGVMGSADGAGNAATLNHPVGVAVDSGGQAYVVGMDHTVRRVRYVSGDRNSSSSYRVDTVAGSAGQSGTVDGVGSAARFNMPLAVTVDRFGAVFVADTWNNSIRVLRSAGLSTMTVTTLATLIDSPYCLTPNAAGDLYVGSPSRIERCSPAAVLTLLAGTAGFADGSPGALGVVSSVSLEESGTLLFCDRSSRSIRCLQRVVNSTPL